MPDRHSLRQPSLTTVEPSTLTCWSRRGAGVDCATGNVITAIHTPVDQLLPGQTYTAAVNPAGVVPQIVDRAGNPATPAERAFAPPTEVEQGSPAVAYSWRQVQAPKAYGRSYLVERSAGATACCRRDEPRSRTMAGARRGSPSYWTLLDRDLPLPARVGGRRGSPSYWT